MSSFLTSDVSSPGMASSSTDLFVNEREGSSVVAEVGADILGMLSYEMLVKRCGLLSGGRGWTA